MLYFTLKECRTWCFQECGDVFSSQLCEIRPLNENCPSMCGHGMGFLLHQFSNSPRYRVRFPFQAPCSTLHSRQLWYFLCFSLNITSWAINYPLNKGNFFILHANNNGAARKYFRRHLIRFHQAASPTIQLLSGSTSATSDGPETMLLQCLGEKWLFHRHGSTVFQVTGHWMAVDVDPSLAAFFGHVSPPVEGIPQDFTKVNTLFIRHWRSIFALLSTRSSNILAHKKGHFLGEGRDWHYTFQPAPCRSSQSRIPPFYSCSHSHHLLCILSFLAKVLSFQSLEASSLPFFRPQYFSDFSSWMSLGVRLRGSCKQLEKLAFIMVVCFCC